MLNLTKNIIYNKLGKDRSYMPKAVLERDMAWGVYLEDFSKASMSLLNEGAKTLGKNVKQATQSRLKTTRKDLGKKAIGYTGPPA